MKKCIKTVLAVLGLTATLVACQKPVVKSEISADVEAIKEVPAHNPADVAVTITSNVNWIVQTPSWVKASVAYGSGNSIVSFSFAENYVNETTTVADRTGEIKISGGGTLDGNGATLLIPVHQLGFTYVDPDAPLGGIPDATEFIKFLSAATVGNPLTRWLDDNNEVVLFDDIDLGEVADEKWQEFADAREVINANNDCTIDGAVFAGVLNGKGHKIFNFNPTVVLETNRTFGLIPVMNGGTIKNLELTGTLSISANGQADAGLLVGTALNSTVKDVVVNGKVKSTGVTVSKRFALGGICGFACAREDANGLFDNCVSNVEADAVGGANLANGGAGAMYGGICGFSTYNKKEGRVTIKNCVNNGLMKVKVGRCSGIVATPNGGTIFESCTNNGNQINEIPDGRLANICCVAGQDCKLVNCVNNGDIEAMSYGAAAGTCAGIMALPNHDTVTIEGGANYGVIKTSRTDGQYVGLLVANFSKFTYIKDIKVSGGIVVNGTAADINAGNFMSYIGTCSAANLEKVTGLTWEDPKN